VATRDLKMMAALERVTKWRRWLASQIIGTAPETKGTRGIRDLQEARIILRVEVTAIIGLLLRKGLFTEEELQEALAEEADALNAAYSKAFPGVRATETGLTMDMPEAVYTMRAWGFPP
jgi:hypothetical protein